MHKHLPGLDAPMATVESEFEQFFKYCNKECFNAAQMDAICRPLIWQQRWQTIRRWLISLLAVYLFYLLWIYCDCFAWTLSAIGRIFLIQLLPYWNWTPLYKTKCLIERSHSTELKTNRPMDALPNYETATENCALCDTLENIAALSNISYTDLETTYLERGLPVLVVDAQPQQNITELLNAIEKKSLDFLKSEPCDVATNLLMRKFFNLETAIQKMRAFNATIDRWFLQLRNCRFSAVKSSRLFMVRPYFYPYHLEPYYSSWLLMSHNYNIAELSIQLRGLIFVQQLSAYYDFSLRPKQPCDITCPAIHVRLAAGECLIFSTDLWQLSYGIRRKIEHTSKSITSIATIFEIDWQI